MAPDFEVTVGADLSAYNAGLQRGVRTAATASTEITRSLGRAAAASTAMGGAVARGSAQAGNALTNLSRVAQDAPFGFIGIQNNLNPLLESFQRLRAETGSNMSALRALGSSLMGPAGIGIALAVVSSALTFYTMWQQKAKKATGESASENKTFAETLDAISQARLKGEQDGAKEIVRLKVLYDATQNANLSMKDRNLAYDELSGKYPKFFSNAEREKTLLGQNTTAYNLLTAAILAAASAKAAEDRISQNTDRQLENRYKIVEEQRKQLELEKQIKIQESKPGVLSQATVGGDITSLSKLQGLYDELAKSQQNVNNLTTDSNVLRKQNLDLSAFALEQEQKAGFKTLSQLDDKIDKTEKLHAVLKDLPNATGQTTFQAPEIGLAINPVSEDVLRGMEAYRKASEAAFNDKSRVNSIIRQNEALKEQEQTVMGITNAFGQGLMGAFQTALSGTQSFISAMGQFLQQLITRLIAAAAAAAILAVILSAVGFGSGLAGAASSFGSFKNLFGSFSGVKLAEGGITTGPTRALIGEGREKEAVMPLSKLQAFVNNNGNGMQNGMVVGVLRGPDQLLQIRRADQQKQRIG